MYLPANVILVRHPILKTPLASPVLVTFQESTCGTILGWLPLLLSAHAVTLCLMVSSISHADVQLKVCHMHRCQSPHSNSLGLCCSTDQQRAHSAAPCFLPACVIAGTCSSLFLVAVTTGTLVGTFQSALLMLCLIVCCRDTAAEVLKEEVAMLRRNDARGSVDVDYVKNVVLNGFESGELSSDSSMLPVLARLLHFSPAELQRIKAAKPSAMKRTLSRTFLNKLTS